MMELGPHDCEITNIHSVKIFSALPNIKMNDTNIINLEESQCSLAYKLKNLKCTIFQMQLLQAISLQIIAAIGSIRVVCRKVQKEKRKRGEIKCSVAVDVKEVESGITGVIEGVRETVAATSLDAELEERALALLEEVAYPVGGGVRQVTENLEIEMNEFLVEFYR
nr:hypothetical protein CR513_49692 [Ipomoea batatas]